MNYYVYIVLLIGSLVSCSESSRHFPRYEDFPDEKALNAQVIHRQTEKGNGFTPLIRSRLKIIMKTSHALHWRKRGEASSTIIPKKASWSWQPN